MNRIDELEKRIAELESVVLNTFRSPDDAAPLLGRSAGTIRRMIRTAEEARRGRGKPRLKYGTHYINVAGEDSLKPTYKVNVAAWRSLPPPGVEK